jgi:hypothetical protein
MDNVYVASQRHKSWQRFFMPEPFFMGLGISIALLGMWYQQRGQNAPACVLKVMCRLSATTALNLGHYVGQPGARRHLM